MGINQSSDIKNTNLPNKIIISTDTIETDILKKCKELIKQYNRNFLNKDFCENFGFVVYGKTNENSICR